LTFKAISLGAGVQSSTLLLMAYEGELGEMPDAAIFADTQWEPKAVYKWLDYLESVVKDKIPVYRISHSNLRADTLACLDTNGFVDLPLFLYNLDGKKGMLKRQCTNHYKILPIRRLLRQIAPKQPVDLWFGISLDEFQRMRDSGRKWLTHKYPLIDRKMTRQDCLSWIESRGYPKPPKSACIVCPFHRTDQWVDMHDNDPESWAEAVYIDKMLRHIPRVRGEAFLHSSRKPLPQALGEPETELHEECTGYCGA
jgi:hypothetical protein